ncbi:D-alanine--D-alanine ligase family protein [Anaerococcus degeneri]|uniref:D-alanine--D-alanine ligase n=1 Tax=Anaerococcus degeneri TaxID=361500 RepID=A0ABS7Z0J3_9FIRM|nr:D-alanine--D-alanine ligase family protein [Anaerococcus degeneri]MBP2014641.1 D-alanine-D-alanine ligase [Anaerococcus degeneri]MCA2096854.1 D-alanine--D-alanine ligase [Anaerococcus degeneri]
MKTVYILCGGPSSEHDIALRSALNIVKNLNKEKYDKKIVYIDKEGKFSETFTNYDPADEFSLVKEISKSKQASIADFLLEVSKEDLENTIILPVVHGTYGEDGTIQGFLDAVGLAYIGNGLLSSAICMDKVTSNDIFEKSKLKQAKYKYCYKEDFNDAFIDSCIAYVGLPLIVKPSANGSSVGVSRVETKEDFKKAGLEALKYDRKLLVEELIVGQEIELAVLGDSDNIDVSDPAAYITDHVFLDWDAKYFSKSTREELPYKMDEADKDKAKEFARACYKAAGCEGFARVDIFYGKDREFYINEINTFPGFTPSSFFARMAMDLYKVDFSAILDMLIEDGFRRSKND